MRFGSILLLLLVVAGIVLAFNYCGPEKNNSENAAGTAVEATKKTTDNIADATQEVTADIVAAGKKPLNSVADLVDRVPLFTSANQDGNDLYVHAHEKNATTGPAPAEHVLKNVAAQLPGILMTVSLNDIDTMVVYQTIPVTTQGGSTVEQNIFTYTFDMKAIRNHTFVGEITMWELLPFLIEPTGPKVGKDMSMVGMKVRDAICSMKAPDDAKAETLKSSALCKD